MSHDQQRHEPRPPPAPCTYCGAPADAACPRCGRAYCWPHGRPAWSHLESAHLETTERCDSCELEYARLQRLRGFDAILVGIIATAVAAFVAAFLYGYPDMTKLSWTLVAPLPVLASSFTILALRRVERRRTFLEERCGSAQYQRGFQPKSSLPTVDLHRYRC